MHHELSAFSLLRKTKQIINKIACLQSVVSTTVTRNEDMRFSRAAEEIS